MYGVAKCCHYSPHTMLMKSYLNVNCIHLCDSFGFIFKPKFTCKNWARIQASGLRPLFGSERAQGLCPGFSTNFFRVGQTKGTVLPGSSSGLDVSLFGLGSIKNLVIHSQKSREIFLKFTKQRYLANFNQHSWLSLIRYYKKKKKIKFVKIEAK